MAVSADSVKKLNIKDFYKNLSCPLDEELETQKCLISMIRAKTETEDGVFWWGFTLEAINKVGNIKLALLLNYLCSLVKDSDAIISLEDAIMKK